MAEKRDFHKRKRVADVNVCLHPMMVTVTLFINISLILLGMVRKKMPI